MLTTTNRPVTSVVKDIALLGDCILTEDSAGFQHLYARFGNDPKRLLWELLEPGISQLGKAFYSGDISLETFLSVAIFPLPGIARKALTVPANTSPLQELRETAITLWFQGIREVLIPVTSDSFQLASGLKQSELANSMVISGSFLQDLASLISGPKANLILHALNIIESMRRLPADPASFLEENSAGSCVLGNKRVCRKILKAKPVMEALLTFCLSHATRAPRSDMEFLAVKGRKLLADLSSAVENRVWKSGRSSENRFTMELCGGPGGKWKNQIYTLAPGTPETKEVCETVFLSPPRTDSERYGVAVAEIKLSGLGALVPAQFEEGFTDALGRMYLEKCQNPGPVRPASARFTSGVAHGQVCRACGKSGAAVKLQMCVRCKQAWYCGKECQVSDWKRHKRECKKSE